MRACLSYFDQKSFKNWSQKSSYFVLSGACSSLCNIKWSASEKWGKKLERFANQTKHRHRQRLLANDLLLRQIRVKSWKAEARPEEKCVRESIMFFGKMPITKVWKLCVKVFSQKKNRTFELLYNMTKRVLEAKLIVVIMVMCTDVKMFKCTHSRWKSATSPSAEIQTG